MSLPVAVVLAELRSPLEKSYRNTAYCAGSLEQDKNGRLRGKYCGNRWCLVCSRVRIARAINRYLPVIAGWVEPQLVTLTIPNIRAGELGKTISEMMRDSVAIARSVRRTDRLPLRALRKLECTYNADRDDYHPHFHIAVEGRVTAEAIVRRWLELNTEASSAAQDIRPCNGGALKELFKYFTKLITKRPDSTATREVSPAVALDVIFSAMRGRRVFQAMGFRVATCPTKDENAAVGIVGDTLAPSRRGDSVVWEWMQDLHDWIDLETGDILSGYQPTDAFTRMIQAVNRPA